MYHFRLQRTDGSPADPPTYRSLTLNWRQGDTIPFNAERTFRVLGVRLRQHGRHDATFPRRVRTRASG